MLDPPELLPDAPPLFAGAFLLDVHPVADRPKATANAAHFGVKIMNPPIRF
jgi:hypothetical protein